MTARRRGREQGIGVLEAALTLPLLLLLAFGVIEAGFALRDGNTLARAVQASARVDARVADGRSADYEALRALDSALSSIDTSSIERVVVFDATSTGGTVPAQCLTVARPDHTDPIGFGGVCNVYSKTQVESDSPGSFDGPCPTGWDRFYCPTTRDRSGENPDRVGIHVRMSFDKVVKVLPGSLTLDRTAVFQLEPCVAGDPTC